MVREKLLPAEEKKAFSQVKESGLSPFSFHKCHSYFKVTKVKRIHMAVQNKWPFMPNVNGYCSVAL